MDSAETSNSKQSPKPLGSLGRDEMNLAEFPIALLTDRVPKDQKEAVYQDEIFDERSGRTVARQLTITAGNHGLTTPVDDEIILALIQLTRQKNNFTNRRLEFNRHELVQMLGWSVGGAKYERIETALDRWTSVYLKYENAWRDNRTKTWTTVGFHIIDKYELNDTRTGSDQLDLIPSYIVWGEDIFESFQAGYLKPLDYDLCMGLRHSTAKRMYRFLDKRFHHKPKWDFDLKELSHEHIGLGRHYEGPAHLKRNLRPALIELESINFIEPLPDNGFYNVGGVWKIRLHKKGASETALPAAEQESEPPLLVAELVKCGVTESVAATLAAKYPAEVIAFQIDAWDWLMTEGKKPEKPVGYLIKSIEGNYSPPDRFVPKATREQLEAEKQRKAIEAEQNRRVKQQEVAQERQDRENVEEHVRTLSPEERSELEAAALAHANPDMQANYNDPALARVRDTLMVGLVREYLAPLLRDKQRQTTDA